MGFTITQGCEAGGLETVDSKRSHGYGPGGS